MTGPGNATPVVSSVTLNWSAGAWPADVRLDLGGDETTDYQWDCEMQAQVGVDLTAELRAAQVEGSVVYGLGAAFYQEITIKEGRVVEENFDTFETLLIDQMPRIETVLVPSGGFWGGVGEPTIMVAAPAVMNAIFAATGKRIRTLPLKHHGLV